MSQKRMRTQSSAVMEPDNQKRQELEIEYSTEYDHDDPETKPMPAKDREKLGVSVGSAVYCSYEITPLHPSFFRQEILFGPPPDQSEPSEPLVNRSSPSPAPPTNKAIAKHGNHIERLYVCETCFRYTPYLDAYMNHVDGRCQHVHAPPGCIVYLSTGMPYHPDKVTMPTANPRAPPWHRDLVLRQTPGYALYEIDGDKDKLFCQNLSLFSKLWVESKSVGFDVGGFVFYVLVLMTPPKPGDVADDKFSKKRAQEDEQADEQEDEEVDIPNRIVGYFSKEKNSWDNNSLACILVFPPWQGQGIGQLLIQASYVLGEREGRFGGPERPLSDSGRKSYEAYWANAVCQSLLRLTTDNLKSGEDDCPSISDVAKDAWIVPEDVIATLKRMGWAEGLLESGEADKAQKLVINSDELTEYLLKHPSREALEPNGWLFDDSSGESSSSEEEAQDDESEGSDEAVELEEDKDDA